MNYKYHWHKIADDEAGLPFAENNLLRLEVAGRDICIAKGNKLYACAAICPHASGNIADGLIDGRDNIICPVHQYKFSLQNGRNVNGEEYYLRTYPLKINEEGIFIGIEAGSEQNK